MLQLYLPSLSNVVTFCRFFSENSLFSLSNAVYLASSISRRHLTVPHFSSFCTPIDMSSFYLPNDFFFSSELRRHSGTNHLHDYKCKNNQTRTYYLSQQIHCSNGAFSFPNETSPGEFVSRPIRAIALCIPTVHHLSRKMHAYIREEKISCSFFQPVRKIVIAT